MLNLLVGSIFSVQPLSVSTNAVALPRWRRQLGMPVVLLLAGLASTALHAAEPMQHGLAQQPGVTPGLSAHSSSPLSADARAVRDWVRQSGNNAQLPFVLIDKRSAAIHVFDAAGMLQASSPALLGLARGDASVPGIGERPISQIAPHERTTPAGRFVSEPGRNLQGEDIVWISYDDAVSLHRVRPGNPAERRRQRLASRTAADNRISFGCVNLPAAFYNRFVAPTLGHQPGVIYVLPETQPVAKFFGFAPATAQHSTEP